MTQRPLAPAHDLNLNTHSATLYARCPVKQAANAGHVSEVQRRTLFGIGIPTDVLARGAAEVAAGMGPVRPAD